MSLWNVCIVYCYVSVRWKHVKNTYIRSINFLSIFFMHTANGVVYEGSSAITVTHSKC